jgi:leucyl-tRNA synthetase
MMYIQRKNFEMYDHKVIESKWQNSWDFKADEDRTGEKFYVLEMFPYPSGKMHMGHVRNYTLGDVVARFKMMQGFNVLHPMGWDAFGLPAENAARQFGVNPAEWTEKNIEEMRAEIKRCGFSYDWNREIKTCDPEYYRHEQEFFIKFFEAGLIYQKDSLVNWDPVDKTVLANEQVVNGRGWRSGAIVEKKSMTQWFCKITDFADELLKDLESLDEWPESIRTMQHNWIGRSEGAVIRFSLCDMPGENIEVYTTRPDTIFGCAFIGIAYDHKILEFVEKSSEMKEFIKECAADSVSEAVIETKDKKGFETGLFVQHPFNSDVKIPVYIANFVLSTYGTGAVFGCPGHDERDHEFAKRYNLPIRKVVEGGDEDCYTGEGLMINSQFLDGLHSSEAKQVMIKFLEERGLGNGKVNYRLRDWGISRQKYWGCPIPIINCNSCGVVTVPLEQLPVELPKDVDFSAQGNPLVSHPTWKHVKCPKCGGNGERETDTLDTFFESSWYFARFCTTDTSKAIDSNKTSFWMPVDCYIGGPEHAVMHLLYARFFTKALKKCGYWEVDEPFKTLYTQGMVCNAAYKDKSGTWVEVSDVEALDGRYYKKSSKEEVFLVGSEKMSKSKKNGIEPKAYIDKFGADTIRMFVLSDSPPDKDLDWNDGAVEGIHRYIQRLYRASQNASDVSNTSEKHDEVLERLQHKTIHNVTADYNDFHINKAIARIRELNNALNEAASQGISTEQQVSVFKTIVQLLHPIIPHVTAELWEKLAGNGKMVWPKHDEKLLVDDEVTVAVQVKGKLRGTLKVKKGINQNEVEILAMEIQSVKQAIGENKILKIIYVQDRIINFIC